ncbi:MAG: hypothetical protein ACFCBW_09050, partial [Candidatus Competibacterales bacterium]
MAELILQLRTDPTTGKKDLLVHYQSGGDRLPMEHEHDHRQWVERLVEGVIVKASELGRVVVTREAVRPQAGVEDNSTATEPA